jgi:hypothetical protein
MPAPGPNADLDHWFVTEILPHEAVLWSHANCRTQRLTQ